MRNERLDGISEIVPPDSLANVVIPYSRFQECQENRRRLAAERVPRDRPAPIDADVAPVAAPTVSPQMLSDTPG
jgi:hypothetical protein